MTRRGRYAPSPSGHMHIGNARTALLAWLQMRSLRGVFVLRIEDIDKQRCRPEYTERVIHDLRWLGLDWDEGPDIGGPFAPYTQSERETMYQDALNRLQQDGVVYPCTCTRSKLQAIASAPHGLSSEGPSYPGTCRLTPVRVDQIEQSYSLRFALPEESITFVDGIHGVQHIAPGAGGDFVVKRSDGSFGYQLAVVVDDAAMEITDVLRGDDLLDSTSRQLFLFKALERQAPTYSHIPLLYGPDGSRLSKRHGSISLTVLRESGVTAEQLVGYLAFWSGLIDAPMPVKPRELITDFDLAKVQHHPVLITEEHLASLLHKV